MNVEKTLANIMLRMERHYFGKYRGFVVDNDDPSHLGRLKLKVPSVLGNDVVTGWALPCAPYGGDANHGALFIPEQNAGVWVEFEEGDLEFPIWVGTFWSSPSGNTELPKTNGADGKEDGSVQSPPTRKIIKTKKGHTLQFEDKDNEELVLLYEATNKHTLKFNADGIKITDSAHKHDIEMSSSGITVTDGTNKNTITLDSNGMKLETQAGAKIEFNATGITVDAGSGILTLTGTLIKIGDGAMPAVRMGDSGVGNMGAPVPITVVSNTKVLI